MGRIVVLLSVMLGLSSGRPPRRPEGRGLQARYHADLTGLAAAYTAHFGVPPW